MFVDTTIDNELSNDVFVERAVDKELSPLILLEPSLETTVDNELSELASTDVSVDMAIDREASFDVFVEIMVDKDKSLLILNDDSVEIEVDKEFVFPLSSNLISLSLYEPPLELIPEIAIDKEVSPLILAATSVLKLLLFILITFFPVSTLPI